MTKQEFVDAVADRAGIGKGEAAKAVDAVLDTITDTLRRRDAVTFTGFGKFSTSAARPGWASIRARERRSRSGRRPCRSSRPARSQEAVKGG